MWRGHLGALGVIEVGWTSLGGLGRRYDGAHNTGHTTRRPDGPPSHRDMLKDIISQLCTLSKHSVI